MAETETNKADSRKFTAAAYAAAFAGFAAALFIDQFTKYLAVLRLKGQSPAVLIDGVFELHYLENRGAAFGIMQGRQTVFIVGAVVICAVIFFIYGRIPKGRKYLPLRICSVLVCAGAIGNLIDRVRYDYVVDFFYFSLIDFPIFNVADCYVVVSCVLFAVLVMFYYKDEDFMFLSKNRNK